MPYIRANDAAVYYEFAGPSDAPVVMLANSLGTNVHVWDAVVPELAAGSRVLRFDMRGHGLTDAGPEPTMQDLANDALALLDALEIARVRFIGLSIGGMIGQQFAADHPERVEALVLCATASRIGTASVWNERIAAVRQSGTAAITRGVLARWFTPETHSDQPELIRGFGNMLARTPADGYAGACAAIRDADLAIRDGKIAAPTLVVSGAQDAVTPPSDGQALCDAIPGARLAVIDGAAHIIPAERPSDFVHHVVPFLRDPLAVARA